MNNSSDLASTIVQRFNYYSNSIPAYDVEVDEIEEGKENDLSSLDKEGTIKKNLQHIRGMNWWSGEEKNITRVSRAEAY